MLDKIKKKLQESYNLEENRGLFISGFDNNSNLLFSNGVVYTDKSLQSLIDILNKSYVENQDGIDFLALDVVGNVEDISKNSDILSTDITNNGILVVESNGDNSGAILPNVEGIADIKNALSIIKNKNQIEGKVKILKFTTERILVR